MKRTWSEIFFGRGEEPEAPSAPEKSSSPEEPKWQVGVSAAIRLDALSDEDVTEIIRVLTTHGSGYMYIPATALTLQYRPKTPEEIEAIEEITAGQHEEGPTPSSVIRDDAADRRRDGEIIENMLKYLEDRLYELESAEREGRLEKTVVSEATWAGLSAVRSLAQIVRKTRRQ